MTTILLLGEQRCLRHDEIFRGGSYCPGCADETATEIRNANARTAARHALAERQRTLAEELAVRELQDSPSTIARRAEESVLATYYGKAAIDKFDKFNKARMEHAEAIRALERRGRLERFVQTLVGFPKSILKAVIRIETLSSCGDYFNCIAIRGFPKHRGESFQLDSSLVEALGVVIENLHTSAALHAPARRPQPEERPQIIVDIDW